MAKFIFLCVTLIYCFILPPSVVLKSFQQKFPEAKQTKWSKENAHEYEASFKMNRSSYSANFSDKGKWLETESPTNFISLPSPVQDKINTSKINKATIKAISKIEKHTGAITYELELKKGKKIIEKFYSSDGLELK